MRLLRGGAGPVSTFGVGGGKPSHFRHIKAPQRFQQSRAIGVRRSLSGREHRAQ
jgi:hypothetical protein